MAKETLGESSGKSKVNVETWWWNDEVQQAIREKREKKKNRDSNRCNETIQEYKEANMRAKSAVAKAKKAAYKDWYDRIVWTPLTDKRE